MKTDPVLIKLAWQCIGKSTQDAVSLILQNNVDYELLSSHQVINFEPKDNCTKIWLFESNGLIKSTKLG